jgi:hypothetical protein
VGTGNACSVGFDVDVAFARVERTLLSVALDVDFDLAVDFVSALFMPLGTQVREGHDFQSCRKPTPHVEQRRCGAA